jgi:hypothetical protein
METNETNGQTTKKEKPFITGSALAGTVLLIVGSVLFADRIGADIPHWVFSWPMIVIAVGIFIGAKDRFRDWGFLIPVAVGVVFLINHEVDGWTFRNLWPIIVIAVGLSMILNSFTKKKKHDDWC